jgi:hypothetical protein
VKHAATMIYMTAAIVLEEKSPYGPGGTTMARFRAGPTEHVPGYLIVEFCA